MNKRFLIIILILASCFSEASVTTYRAKYLGAQLNNNAPALIVKDDFLPIMLTNPSWNLDFVNQSVKNRIRLVYTGAEKEITNATTWTANVTFDVVVKDETNTVISTLTGQNLSISNDENINRTKNEDVLNLLFSGFQVEVSNLNVSGFPSTTDDFELIAEIETERYFNLSNSPLPTISHNELTPTNSLCSSPISGSTWDKKLQVYWSYQQGAEEYELEWYFNSAEAPELTTISVASVPTINWTRISTTNNYYEISLPFDDGKLFYRLRSVGRFLEAPTKYYYGDYTAIGEYVVSNNEKNKNWTYNATYAEGGKVKEVVNYSDGSGRSRQAVTRLSTEDVAIVSETFYDYEGRPVIQTLPTPDVNRSKNLNFYCGYSLNNTNELLRKKEYDYFPGCDLNAPQLGLNNGASNYYSSSNPDKNKGENQVIPDAEQYPYTQTVYGKDGRVKYQSMPGSKHSITENNTVTDNRFTQYAYATPLQFKLDRLFGNEVGYARHYNVNAVTDANGQTSLSYLDLSGRVIATSLIGSAPSNLDGLPSNTGATTITANFNNLNNYSPTTESYIINSSFLVEVAGNHTFNYTLTPEDVSALCTNAYGCVYDLEITIFDDCDNKIEDQGVLSGGNSSGNNEVLHTQYITLDGTNLPVSNTTGSFNVNFTTTGTYSIKKELKLNQANLDLAITDFKADYLANCLTSSDLPIDTENCLSCEDFCLQYPDSCGVNECSKVEYKGCEILLEQLAIDMSPGGQYFDNITTGNTGNIDDWLENFVEANLGSTVFTNMDFRNPSDQTLLTSWQAIRDNWQPDWATKTFNVAFSNPMYPAGIVNLLQAHPEYCHYAICLDLEASSTFNMEFSISPTLPSQFGTGTTTYGVSAMSTVVDNMISDDPFFPAYYSDVTMKNGPYTNINNNSGGQDIYDDIDDIIQNQITSGQTIATLNDAWPTIRAAYLERKHIWVKAYKESQDCYYLLDYQNSSGSNGYFDNLAETFISPGSILNAGAYNYYNPKFTALSNSLNNALPADGYHDLYFDQFKIREPDYLDFINNGIGQTGFPNDMQDFVNDFNDQIGFTYCDQLISCTNMTEICIYSSPYLKWSGNYIINDTSEYPDKYLQLTATIDQTILYDNYILNTLTNPIQDGETYTVTAKVRSTTALTQVEKLLISGVNNNGFDGYLSSSTYGPTSAHQEIIYDVNSTVIGPVTDIPEGQWNSISITFTANDDYDYLMFYFDKNFDNHDNSLEIKDVFLNKVCSDETVDFNCFCTQIDMALSSYAEDEVLTLPLTSVQLADFYNVMATQLNNNFTSTTTIYGDNIAQWRTNCIANNDPNEGTPLTFVVPDEMNCSNEEPCLKTSQDIVNYYNNLFDQQKLNQAVADFKNHYKASCFGGSFKEDFTIEYSDREYHYTLYYYDRAGNLERTIPPAGVDVLTNTEANQVDDYRKGVTTSAIYPNHTFKTSYEYNTLNQLVRQTTPDGGTTQFWYDDIGRLKASQNEKQANYTIPAFSYTRYDALGRIIEVGELTSTHAPSPYTNLVLLNSSNFPYNGSWQGTDAIREVTRTYYDKEDPSITPPFTNGQENLRNRVVRTTYQDVVNLSSPFDELAYDNATHYTYDVSGNVKTLITDNPSLANYGQQYKKLNYEYDLVSGNVNRVNYQKGEPDQFSHKYYYDADNRITQVYTSDDGVIWENDAAYFYYLHGPLARTEVGAEKVQGLDYAYTIQGWLKGVNSNNIKSNLQADIGKDGVVSPNTPFYASATDVHENIAKDAFGFNLNYYDDDFTSIHSSGTDFLTDINTLNNNALKPAALYNGNIRQMSTTLMDHNETQIGVQAANYTYDQLNRIKSMEAFTSDLSSLDYLSATTGQYNTTYNYDDNGNLLNLDRKATVNTNMDNLTYYYYDDLDGVFDPSLQAPPSGKATNKLAYVTDAEGSVLGTDLGTQTIGNYTYDEIGNLISDAAEEIANIEWTVYGKIKAITRTASSTKPDLTFTYDASGNRLSKRETPKSSPGVLSGSWITTYYARDASGNVMATYQERPDSLDLPTIYLEDHHIYGSSRLGIVDKGIDLDPTTGNNTSGTIVSTTNFNRIRGNKKYELSNHLGNVLSTVSDRKLLVPSSETGYYWNFTGGDDKEVNGSGLAPTYNTSNTVSGYDGENNGGIETDINDYIDFSDEPEFDFGSNDFTISVWANKVSQLSWGNTVINKWNSASIPGANEWALSLNGGVSGTTGSAFLVESGTTIYEVRASTAVSPNTGTWHHLVGVREGADIKLYVDGVLEATTSIGASTSINNIAGRIMKIGRLSNASTYSNMKVDELMIFERALSADQILSIYSGSSYSHYQPDVLSYSDYYPFGMQMPGRNANNGDYRYGFNGMEKDDEIKGNGNSYTTFFRQYDPRLGRWFSPDPKSVAWESPYAAFRNNPIKYTDPRGDCPDGDCDDVVANPTISDDNGGKNNNRVGSSRGHKGIDIIAPKGTDIKAVMGGKVTVINNHKSDEYSGRRRKGVSKSPTTGLGNTVIVETTLENDYTYEGANGKEYTVNKGETVFIKYSHLDIGVQDLHGKTIKAGDKIGVAGATGNAGTYNGKWGIPISKRHVHIESRVGGQFGRVIDPEGFFKTKFDAKGDAIPATESNLIPPVDSSLDGTPNGL